MKELGLKQRFIKNSFWSLISLLLGKIGALIFTIILARFLMPENYGVYSIVLSTVMICYTFADLGVNKALVRYLSFSLVKNKKKIYPYYQYLLKIKLILVLSASLLLLALSYPLTYYVFKNSLLFLPFILASFYILVLSLEGFYTEMFYPIEKIKYIGLKESLTQILRIISALLVFYFIASSYQVIGIFASLILIHLFVLLIIFLYIQKLIPEIRQRTDAKINKPQVRKFVGFLTIATISGVFFSYIDSLMLGFYLSPEFVGYYRAAFALVIGAANVLAFPNVLLLPVLTKINKKNTEKILNNVFKYTFILSIPTTFGIIIFAKYIIMFFYGAQYLPATNLLYFLTFLIIPMISVGMLLPIFTAKEKPQIFAKLIVLTSILNVILNFILIKALLSVSPIWATTGAAIATLISWIIYSVLAFYTVKKEFKINLSLRPTLKPLIASTIIAVVLIYLISHINNIDILSGIALVILGALIYFALMILIRGLNKYDLNLFKLLFKQGKF